MQARRLRARLVRYYREEGGTDALVIELPKGGYAPVFKQRDAGAAVDAVDRRRRWPARTPSPCCRSPITAPPRDLDYFCHGLRQEIVHRLATIEALRVLAAAPDAAAEALDRDRPGGDAAER